MTEPLPQSAIKERISTYLYFGSPYFAAVGILYLWGYWSTFDINILEYLNLTDILKSTAYPIASAFIFSIIGGVFTRVTLISNTQPLIQRDSKAGKFLRRSMPYIATLYFLGTFLLLMLASVWKWAALPTLLSFPIAVFIDNRGFLHKTIPDERTRTVVLLLLTSLPLLAYGQGRLKAEGILVGETFQYVLSPIEGTEIVPTSTPLQRLRVLGHAGDFIFLFDPEKRAVVISGFKEPKALTIKQFKRTNPTEKIASKLAGETVAPAKAATIPVAKP
ncbi:hypothetical protein [Collimonas humicola]|uniref:hypothetical protein n=1 Tax=Collimonas humicola TaxID=2825886 RepID=UPI001B8B8932|nr:hypothetical protein [Collimonas humicola]